jgi:hypothetical protein
MEKRLRDAGVKRIDWLHYRGNRHEMSDELNGDDATADIINLLDQVLSLWVE